MRAIVANNIHPFFPEAEQGLYNVPQVFISSAFPDLPVIGIILCGNFSIETKSHSIQKYHSVYNTNIMTNNIFPEEDIPLLVCKTVGESRDLAKIISGSCRNNAGNYLPVIKESP